MGLAYRWDFSSFGDELYLGKMSSSPHSPLFSFLTAARMQIDAKKKYQTCAKNMVKINEMIRRGLSIQQSGKTCIYVVFVLRF